MTSKKTSAAKQATARTAARATTAMATGLVWARAVMMLLRTVDLRPKFRAKKLGERMKIGCRGVRVSDLSTA
jgi:hypothetical protein